MSVGSVVLVVIAAMLMSPFSKCRSVVKREEKVIERVLSVRVDNLCFSVVIVSIL